MSLTHTSRQRVAFAVRPWEMAGAAARALLALTCLAVVAWADAQVPATNAVSRLPEVVVEGRQDSQVGVADSANQGTTGAAQLADRPVLRNGELLETVPGMIITQHAGGGKANQYFLRGFSLDHGTDFAVFLDDMPLNLPSHAHGEGYADMNVVINEFVERVDYEKGPYYANVGDFGSAGAAHLVFYKTLPQDFVTVEGGMFGYARTVFGMSQKLGEGNLLYGAEAYHDDGPWSRPDDYQKFNGIVTYSQGDKENGFSVTARAYHGRWYSSDQIPAGFGQSNFYGTLDPTDGGTSQRYSLQAEWHHQDADSETKITAYGFYYYMDLFSDFTYYLVDPVRGDQFEQEDDRWVGGLDASHALFNQWFGCDVKNTFGLQARSDAINNGLYQTQNRARVEKFDVADGAWLPATTEADHFTDTVVGFYVENKVQWTEKFRTVATLRGDVDYFDVTSNNPANNGTSSTFVPGPKLGLIFGPWEKTEIYIQAGMGYHSNDGRGATQNVQPVSAGNPTPGTRTSPVPGLISTKGGEIGVRTAAIPNLESSLSFWYLYSDSELLQDGDTGGTVASASPSNRYGVEWANYYKLTQHLALDFDGGYSIARFTGVDADDASPGSPGGTHVPEAVGLVISSGITLHDFYGFSASLRARCFGPRDLTSDGQYRSSTTLMVNGEVGYQINKTWRVSVELLNMLNRHDHDIDYAYQSQVSPTAAPVFEAVYHPVEPFQARVVVSAKF
jgi:TonB dependent receptor/TonB-dependent Receptor Plug Domain